MHVFFSKLFFSKGGFDHCEFPCSLCRISIFGMESGTNTDEASMESTFPTLFSRTSVSKSQIWRLLLISRDLVICMFKQWKCWQSKLLATLFLTYFIYMYMYVAQNSVFEAKRSTRNSLSEIGLILIKTNLKLNFT